MRAIQEIQILLLFCTVHVDGALFEKGFVRENFVIASYDSFNIQHELKTVSLSKSMYKDSQIMFKISCTTPKLKPDEDKKDVKFLLKFEMYYDKCHGKKRNGSEEESYYSLPSQVMVTLSCQKHVLLQREILDKLFILSAAIDKEMIGETPNEGKSTEKPKVTQKQANNKLDATTKVVKSTAKPTETKKKLPPTTKLVTSTAKPTEKPKLTAQQKKATLKVPSTKKLEDTQSNSRKKRSSDTDPQKLNQAKANRSKTTRSQGTVGENKLPLTMQTGFYQITLRFQQVAESSDKQMEFEVYIESKAKSSFLSAINWPLLPFFGFMSLLYLAFAIGWFIVSCCNWKDLLRVQFWVGGVIGIGMLENALFYAEYQSISHTGKENGLLYVAELTSCAKRALARILVVIVSKGFGIVKPRLGQTLHKVLAVGTLYFIVASIEGCIRVHDGGLMRTNLQAYAMIPVSVVDVGLCWWVFTSLVQTTRTLRIRKNVVKLTLYRHFTNALIFTVLASLAYLAWSVKEFKFTHCLDITSLWLQDALWPFLFALILAVVMILWRPSINNQRYAFTPLDLGGSDDEDDDMTFSEAFEGMKMRSKSESTANGGVNKNRNKAEDDLKWVEENIPSTLLPTMDSDEEILTTKFEISKMD